MDERLAGRRVQGAEEPRPPGTTPGVKLPRSRVWGKGAAPRRGVGIGGMDPEISPIERLVGLL